MGYIFLYISANFLLFFKGPWPFKSQKTHFSGLTTQYAPRLNLGPSAAKKHDSGWVIAWIFLDSGRNFFRSRIINNNCNKKIRETRYTLLFADFWYILPEENFWSSYPLSCRYRRGPIRDHLRLYTVPTAVVKILAGTFPLSADPGKVIL